MKTKQQLDKLAGEIVKNACGILLLNPTLDVDDIIETCTATRLDTHNSYDIIQQVREHYPLAFHRAERNTAEVACQGQFDFDLTVSTMAAHCLDYIIKDLWEDA